MIRADRSVVVTGAGLICALGDRPGAVHEALCGGASGLGPSALIAEDVTVGHQLAEIRDFSPRAYLGTRSVGSLDRTGRLAATGVELAFADSGWSADDRKARVVGLVLGTMFCSVKTIGEFDRRAQGAGPEYASPMDFSNTVLNAASGQVAIWHHLRGVNATVAAGSVSGLHAIGYAADLIRRGRADVIVAGGVEEVCFESFHGFRQAGLLAAPADGHPGCAVPFDRRRSGAALGEASAFVVLEAEEVAAARGARVAARIEGFAAGYDPRRDAEQTAGANALADVIRRALHEARIPSSDIGAVMSSASGSPVGDAREAAGIQCGIGAGAPVTALASMLGDTLGASGALQTIMAIESMRAGRWPGIAGLDDPDPAIEVPVAAAGAHAIQTSHALVTGMAREGNCCALVLGLA
ncbi:MAG: beta-ketoacyl synthase N-terminal-like domain-containing protein [Vicinamibacterales bacterium]